MAEARSVRDFGRLRLLAAATVSPYEVHQAPTGEAGVYDKATAAASDSYIELTTRGTYGVAKTAGVVILKGGRCYWDHSANAVTFEKVNDRDFYVGRAAEDATSAATIVYVDLNIDPPYDIDLMRDPYLTVPVGTQALGGFLPPQRRGGSLFFELTATNEAQKLDALSVDGFATGANAIAEFVFRVPSVGAGTVVDVSIGLANGTHATDADSIAESIFAHLDANNTNIYLESDDGTTEVAATDSTTDITAGSAVANRKEVWMDMRDPADVQIYVDGVLVLSSTVFNVNAAVGPWFILIHIEKTASTDAYQLSIDRACVRFAEQ